MLAQGYLAGRQRGQACPLGNLDCPLPQLTWAAAVCQCLLSVWGLYGTGTLPLGLPLDVSWGLQGCLLSGREVCCTSVVLVPVLTLLAGFVAMLSSAGCCFAFL